MTEEKEKDPKILAKVIRLCAFLLIATLLAAIATFLYFNWQIGAERNRQMEEIRAQMGGVIEALDRETQNDE